MKIILRLNTKNLYPIFCDCLGAFSRIVSPTTLTKKHDDVMFCAENEKVQHNDCTELTRKTVENYIHSYFDTMVSAGKVDISVNSMGNVNIAPCFTVARFSQGTLQVVFLLFSRLTLWGSYIIATDVCIFLFKCDFNHVHDQFFVTAIHLRRLIFAHSPYKKNISKNFLSYFKFKKETDCYQWPRRKRKEVPSYPPCPHPTSVLSFTWFPSAFITHRKLSPAF